MMEDPVALYRKVDTFFSAADEERVSHLLGQAARDAGTAQGAVVSLRDAATNQLSPCVALGMAEHWSHRKGLDAVQAIGQAACASAAPLVAMSDLSTSEVRWPQMSDGTTTQATCALALRCDGEIMGTLHLFWTLPQPQFTQLEPVLTMLTMSAARALQTNREHQRERMLRERMQALDAASKTLSGDLSRARVLRNIVETATNFVSARYGALGVIGADGFLSDFITTGLAPTDIEMLGQPPRGHGLLGVLIHSGQSLRIPNIMRDPRRYGFPPHHPSMTSLLGVPIRVHGKVVGDLYLTDKMGASEFSADDQMFVELLAAHASTAIENAQLYAHSRELIVLRERERISRDLHDGIIQDIYAAILHLEGLADDVTDDAVRVTLHRMTDHLSGVITDVRAYIRDLQPQRLVGRTLNETLQRLLDEIAGEGQPVCRLEIVGAPYPLASESTEAVVQAAHEALSNALRHAQASQIVLSIDYAEAQVRVSVRDNGIGFDLTRVTTTGHHGLANMQARMAEIDAHCHIESTPGQGTQVTLLLDTTALTYPPIPDEAHSHSIVAGGLDEIS